MAINKDINPQILQKPINTPPPLVFLRPDSEFSGADVSSGINKNKPLKNLAMLVSKKYFKTAVARNKAKRLIREAVKVSLMEENRPISSVFLKINAQKSILDVQFQDIVALVRREIRKQKVR